MFRLGARHGPWRTQADLRHLLLLVLWPSVSLSDPQNRTIDDQRGDSVTGRVPAFTPASSWSQGSTCDGCLITPVIDTSQVFDGTWHDSTYSNGEIPVSVALEFSGTAIYIYCILVNQVPYTSTLTNLSFTLDGDVVGSFVHQPDQTDNVQYHALVYSENSLQNGPHTLQVNSEGLVANALTLFDYAIYTVDIDPVTTTQEATSTTPSPSSETSLVSPTSSPSRSTSATQSDTATRGTAGNTQSSTATQGTTDNTQSPSSAQSSSSTTQWPLQLPTGPPSTTHKHPDLAAIVGGTAGGVVCGALLALLALFCIRRRKGEKKRVDAIKVGTSDGGEMGPFGMNSNGFPHVMPTGTTVTSWTSPMWSYVPSTERINASVPGNPSSSSADTVHRDAPDASGPNRFVLGRMDTLEAGPPERVVPANGSGSNSSRRRRQYPAPGSKAMLRQQELDAQMRDIEREVTVLQSRNSQSRNYARSSSAGGTSISQPPSEGSLDADGRLQAQIDRLRRMVERLQVEREASSLWMEDDEPPPQYDHEEEGYELADPLVEDGLAPSEVDTERIL